MVSPQDNNLTFYAYVQRQTFHAYLGRDNVEQILKLCIAALP